MLGKSAVHEVIASQWRAAVKALDRAKKLFIVGYSFPETDVFMTRLLAEGLKHNEGLEEVTIVDIAKLTEDWVAKLHQFFNPVALQKTIYYLSRNAKTFINDGGGTNSWETVINERVRIA